MKGHCRWGLSDEKKPARDTLGQSFPGKGTGKCQGPEAGTSLVVSRHRQKAGGAGGAGGDRASCGVGSGAGGDRGRG